jgi:hypothetical protein
MTNRTLKTLATDNDYSVTISIKNGTHIVALERSAGPGLLGGEAFAVWGRKECASLKHAEMIAALRVRVANGKIQRTWEDSAGLKRPAFCLLLLGDEA